MAHPSVYIILSTSGIGGAEKRFFGLWQSLQQLEDGPDVKIVCTPALYRLLEHNAEFAASLRQFPEQIISADIGASGFTAYREKIAAFVRQHVAPGSILHFIGDHPLMKFRGIRQIYSITQSSMANLNTTGKIGQYGGVYFSDHTDILDPGIAGRMKKLFFYKRNSLSQTASSFCDTEIFRPVPPEQKKDWVVFLGRFEPMKQVVQLLKALPQTYKALQGLASEDLHFFILGHGSQEQELKTLLQDVAYKDLPVTIGYEQHPEKVLNQSSVFLSLQHHNNYPSKSLLEAMAAGNMPLVTDVGQTRWIAKPDYSAYVPEHFTTQELSDALQGIFRLGRQQRREKEEQARALVLQEHTIERMRDYYSNIYRQFQPCVA